MLDAHPDLAIPPEANFISLLIQDCEGSKDPRKCFLETLTSDGKWSDFHVETEILRQRIAVLNPFSLSDAIRAFYKLYAERFGKSRWGDKSTTSIVNMSMIQKALPEARFIHLIRDGRDVALSRSKWIFGNSIRDAAERWVSRIRKARRQVRDLNYYMEIRYEDLVLHSERSLKEVCQFIDLPWNSAMLDYYKTSKHRLAELEDCIKCDGRFLKAEERRRKHQLTKKPPAGDRIGRWRTEMTDSDREWFEKLAGKLLEDLGYEISCNLVSHVSFQE